MGSGPVVWRNTKARLECVAWADQCVECLDHSAGLQTAFAPTWSERGETLETRDFMGFSPVQLAMDLG